MKNKVKKSKSFIKIYVEILDYINGTNSLIKFYENYDDYDFYNYEKNCINNTLLITYEKNIRSYL